MTLEATISNINGILTAVFPERSYKVKVEACKIYIGDAKIKEVTGFVLPRDVVDAVFVWINSEVGKFRLAMSGLARVSRAEALSATTIRIDPDNPLAYSFRH